MKKVKMTKDQIINLIVERETELWAAVTAHGLQQTDVYAQRLRTAWLSVYEIAQEIGII